LQERDRIVAFLTPEYGQKRGVAQGARGKFSRFAGRLQPLDRVRVRWAEKEHRELVRISEVETLRPAAALQADLEGILIGAYLAEHMTQFTQDGEVSEPLYRLLDTTTDALLDGLDRDLAARYVEIWVLRLSGILPIPRECPLCDRPILDRARLLDAEGAIICPDCGHGHRSTVIRGEVLAFLRRSGRENLSTLAADPPPRSALRGTEELCGRVRRHFLQSELKSYRVMRDTLGL
ncbi:MAG: DNA repair protein RecO, partial [Acidobacteriota bacterium]